MRRAIAESRGETRAENTTRRNRRIAVEAVPVSPQELQ